MTGFAGQLGWEVRRVFGGRQAWLGLGVVAGFELLFVGLLQLGSVRPALVRHFNQLGYAFDEVFSGLTLAQHVVGYAMAAPGAACITLVASQSVAGEADAGTLRLLLCRPVSRMRIWCVKLLACAGYAVAVVAFASLLALGLGLACAGSGALLVHVPATGGRWLYAFRDGVLLFAWGTVFHAMSMLTLAVTAFALSCLRLRAATAAIATVAYFLADDALRQLPFLHGLRPWFVMTYVTSWSRVFDPGPGWRWVLDVYGPLAIYDGVVLALAALIFSRRDFKC